MNTKMAKISTSILMILVFNLPIFGQQEQPISSTIKPTVAENIVSTEIIRVDIFEQWTRVAIKIKSWANDAQLAILPDATIKDYYNSNNIYGILEFKDNELNKAYRLGAKGTETICWFAFHRIAPGITKINIEFPNLFDNNIYIWKGVTINNPDNSPKTKWTEQSLKNEWEKNGLNAIEGIYENTILSEGSPKYRLAVKKEEGNYQIIYLKGAEFSNWKEGDIKAYFYETATPFLFKVKWYLGNKAPNENLYITFDQGLMKIIWTDKNILNPEEVYLKLYPGTGDAISIKGVQSSGTGFALTANGLIVTNNHIIEGASNITVRGINGQFDKTYNAKVINNDKNNDLAIIKIDDGSFSGLGKVPYVIKSTANVGENVFVLGYPLRATMGEEIKLTNGIISSKTGFQGDITSYQISAPVQPGNSGGPLFDNQGNLIGIINAKHVGAENVTYAVKAIYLKNLIEMLDNQPTIQSINSLNGKPLTQQVEIAKKFVYIIEIR